MFTTHGDHIPGTRAGFDNPPIRPPRCGGIRSCPDCMLEAASVDRIDYTHNYDEHILTLVYLSLREAGVSDELAEIAMMVMDDKGILFRERKRT